MRIALIGNAPDTLISFRSDLMKALIKGGHEVYAFSPGYSEEQKETVRQMGAIPVGYYLKRMSINPFSEYDMIRQFMKLFRDYDIQVVFSYFVKPVIYGSIAARLTGIAEIYSMLGGLGYIFTDNSNGRFDVKKSVLKLIVTPLFKYALTLNKVVFFQNPDDQEEFIKRRLVNREKTVRIHGSGVNLDQFPFSGIYSEPITFITAGRLLADKGFREYAEAAEIIKKKFPESRFVLLGGHDVNLAALPKEEVESWVSQGIIEWPGNVNNVKDWLEEAAVFVLPSYREGTPRSTLEALAKGLPVITTDVPGCRETVEEGVNGYLVPPRDPMELASKMEIFIRNPERIVEMGLASRKIAEELYDVHKVNRTVLERMGLSNGIPDLNETYS